MAYKNLNPALIIHRLQKVSNYYKIYKYIIKINTFTEVEDDKKVNLYRLLNWNNRAAYDDGIISTKDLVGFTLKQLCN
jgi:hypothetical protein